MPFGGLKITIASRLSYTNMTSTNVSNLTVWISWSLLSLLTLTALVLHHYHSVFLRLPLCVSQIVPIVKHHPV